MGRPPNPETIGRRTSRAEQRARVEILQAVVRRLKIPVQVRVVLERVYATDSIIHSYDDYDFKMLVDALFKQEECSSPDEKSAKGKEIIEDAGYRNAEDKEAFAISAYPAFGYIYSKEEMPGLHKKCGTF